MEKVGRHARQLARRIEGRLLARRGQGTTEYAILVGVLVVIAIIAIVSFRGRIQELWDAIANGIGSL
jgi:Flp pilus assembly pilin Flp